MTEKTGMGRKGRCERGNSKGVRREGRGEHMADTREESRRV